MRSSFCHRLVVLAATAALFGVAPRPTPAQAVNINSQVTFNIPAQSLEAALLELSRQAAFQLIISSGSVPEVNVPALAGKMPIKAAVEQLLRGTDLDYK